MAATAIERRRRDSIRPAGDQLTEDELNYLREKAQNKRRHSTGNSPTVLVAADNASNTVTSLSTTSQLPQSTRQTWWQQFTSAIIPKIKSRRRNSTVNNNNNNIDTSSFEAEQQWYVSEIASATRADNGQAVLFTCLSFNESGELLAAGDKRGHVVVLQQQQANNAPNQLQSKVYTVFQSHKAEFDFQKTENVNEAITTIQWLKRSEPAQFLLSSNERTVKLWKLSEHRQQMITSSAQNVVKQAGVSLRLPLLEPVDPPTVCSTLRREFFGAHEHPIKSLSVNSDLETFLTADDVQVHVWNMSVAHETYNVVDLKPPGGDMEQLKQIITSAEFHPDDCHIFAYSTSDGTARLCDMRQRALCDQHAKLFQNYQAESNGILSSLASSISDLKFGRTGGRYLLTRDFLTLKVWDVRADGSKPAETYPVHPFLAGKLYQMYESDCILDKFECGWGYYDRMISGGSYHHLLHLFDRAVSNDVIVRAEIPGDAPNGRQMIPLKPCNILASGSQRKKKEDVIADKLNFSLKILHTTWHPTECVMATISGGSIIAVHGKPS